MINMNKASLEETKSYQEKAPKRLGIMQPYFFPYIGYFQAIKSVDEYVLYDNLNFSKGIWMYRNAYLSHSGQPQFFNVPLKEKSSFKIINEVEVLEGTAWRKKMLLDFYTTYKRAKCFNDVYPILEKVINYPTDKLTELNYQSIKSVCDYLGINTVISNDNPLFDDIEHKLLHEKIDEATFPDLKFNKWERRVVRVVEMCRLKEADIYINAIGGVNLYPKDEFLANGIELKFVKTKSISYPQFGKEFIPNLSIIDVLMFNTVEEVNHLLGQYELI